MKNRILAWLLCVLMLVGMVPVSVSAAENVATLNGTKNFATIQAAVDEAVEGNNIITLAAGTIKESFSVTQKAGINIEIIGNAAGTTLDGGITVNGNSRQNDAETLTIKNITFNAASTPNGSAYIYIPKANTSRYSHNLFVDGCTFKYSGTDDVNAIKNGTAGCKNWTITNCTVENTIFAFIQTKGTINLVVTGNKVYSKHGLNLDQTASATITDNSFDVNGYAVRVGASSGGKYTANIEISNNTLISDNSPIIIRGVAKNMVTVEGNTVVVPAGVNTVDTSEASDAWVQEKDTVSLASAVAKVGSVQYVSFTEAIAAANAAGTATVELLADVELGEKLTITGNVTIKGAKTITRAAAYTGTLFDVKAGAKLTLDGGLVIDGGNNWIFDQAGYNAALKNKTKHVDFAFVTSAENAPVAQADMFVVTGDVVMNNATIQNHMGNSGCSVFQLNSGSNLALNGAKITHCATPFESTVFAISSANLTINAGTEISGNYGGRNGAVSRNNSGLIVMNGGSINNNYAVNTNGSVFMMYKGEFIMNDGEICSNSSTNGPQNGRCSAIYLHSSGKATINGGVICHNTGISYGGIDTNQTNSVLTINGGSVIENVSVLGNANKDVNMYANTTIAGGTFTQDVSKWCDEGYTCSDADGDGVYSVSEPHDCVAADAWSYDNTHHWHVCEKAEEANCGVIYDKAEHTFEKGVCTVCGAPEEGYVAPPTFDYVLFALAARYAQKYDVIVTADNATVTGDMAIKYKRNGSVEIAPADGYKVVDVIANGISLGAVETVTFKQVKAPQTLVVITEKLYTNPYSDIADDNAAVQYVTENGLMTAVEEGKFDPEGLMTRGALANTLYLLAGSPEVDATVTVNDSEDPAVLWAASMGILTPDADGLVAADATITLAELNAMLNAYAGTTDVAYIELDAETADIVGATRIDVAEALYAFANA